MLRSWPRPPFAYAAGTRTHAGRSSRYEGVGLPGSQLPDFMHTREPLLLNERCIDGRAAARAMKADVMVLDIMVASIPPAIGSRGVAGQGPSKSRLDKEDYRASGSKCIHCLLLT